MASTAAAPPKEPKAWKRPGCPVPGSSPPGVKNHKYCSSKCKQRVVAVQAAALEPGEVMASGAAHCHSRRGIHHARRTGGIIRQENESSMEGPDDSAKAAKATKAWKPRRG